MTRIMSCIMSLSHRCVTGYHKKEWEDLFCMLANCVISKVNISSNYAANSHTVFFFFSKFWNISSP